MSMTLEDLIIQAQKLVADLQDDEDELDKALQYAENTQEEIRHFEKYACFAEEMSNVSIPEEEKDPAHPISDISNASKIKVVRQVHRESARHKDLLKQLREMDEYVSFAHNSLDNIMTQYRQQMLSLIRSKIEAEKFAFDTIKEANKHIAAEKQKNIDQLEKMKKAFKMALKLDEEVFVGSEELLTRLLTENNGLRQMLGVSGQISNYMSLYKIKGNTEDKETQTEDFKGIGTQQLACGDSTAVLKCERTEFFTEDSETTSSTSSFFSASETDNHDNTGYNSFSG